MALTRFSKTGHFSIDLQKNEKAKSYHFFISVKSPNSGRIYLPQGCCQEKKFGVENSQNFFRFAEISFQPQCLFFFTVFLFQSKTMIGVKNPKTSEISPKLPSFQICQHFSEIIFSKNLKRLQKFPRSHWQLQRLASHAISC